jgi:hypothetical protein
MNVDFFLSKLSTGSVHANTVGLAGEEVRRFSRQVADIKSDRRLSATGHAEQIKQAAEKALPFFGQLQQQQASDRRALERRQAKIKLPPPDRARWEEMRELRDYLRTIPLHDRLRLALDDPDYAQAILGQKKELTGVEGDVRIRIEQVEMERLFGAAELAAIKEEAAALDVVDKALEATRDQLLREAGMKPTQPAVAAA